MDALGIDIGSTNVKVVLVRDDGTTLGAAHRPLVWARQITVTDPAHVEVARSLREQFGRTRAAGDDHLGRDLADYDRAFGLDTIDWQVA